MNRRNSAGDRETAETGLEGPNRLLTRGQTACERPERLLTTGATVLEGP